MKPIDLLKIVVNTVLIYMIYNIIFARLFITIIAHK